MKLDFSVCALTSPHALPKSRPHVRFCGLPSALVMGGAAPTLMLDICLYPKSLTVSIFSKITNASPVVEKSVQGGVWLARSVVHVTLDLRL